MVRLTQRSTILLSDSIFVFVLATAQLTAVSSPVVQRHIPWNRKARAGGVSCEAFAPQPAESQGETPPFVSLHHGMSEAFSGGCSTSMLTLPGVMLDHLSWCMIMQDSSPRPNWPRSLLRWCKGTHHGIRKRGLAVCGAKPSHHRLQNLKVKTPLFMPLHHEMTSEAAKKKEKKWLVKLRVKRTRWSQVTAFCEP